MIVLLFLLGLLDNGRAELPVSAGSLTEVTLPPYLPPCLSADQPLFDWSSLLIGDRIDLICRPVRLYSDELILVNRSVHFRHYRCLFDLDDDDDGQLIDFRLDYQCDDRRSIDDGRLRLWHSIFDKRRRQRHLHRRRYSTSTSTSTLRSHRRRDVDSDVDVDLNADADDDRIRFERDVYAATISEELEPPVQVLTVQAKNPDRLPLFYTLLAAQDARSMQAFRIDRQSGRVTTVQRLDRERVARHVLRVNAYESGNPSRSAVASLIIDVEDVNDHSPVFEKPIYIAGVSESADVGTTVLHVHARDGDDGRNGRVSYRLLDQTSGSGSGSESGSTSGSSHPQFVIDSTSGVIKTRSALDREHQDLYKLVVEACDDGQPTPACRTSMVQIGVEDENDNSPQFDQDRYQVEIDENADPTLRPVLVRVRATDADAEENGKVRYSIVGGNSNANRFAIDYDTGDVRLLAPLSHKQQAQYELAVRAQDGGRLPRSNTTLLIVTVRDVNDHAPQFHHQQLAATVREDAAVGAFVASVHAYDDDAGDNARVTYGLLLSDDDSNNNNNNDRLNTTTTTPIPDEFPFELNSVTGTISLRKPIDREQQPVYNFRVLAADHGLPPRSSTVRVLVQVLDMNDNAPEFQHSVYNVSVPEDAVYGTRLVRVRATDPDEASSRLDYSISAGNEDSKFLLINQGDDAELTVNGKLDFKSRSVYALSVKASDSGGRHDTAVVYVHVWDVNSAPFFGGHPFLIRVPENEPIGSTVAALAANDDDAGDNARLSYTMDDQQGYFRIDQQTGVISVNRSLDRESTARFDLTVTASDNGQPSLSASTSLEIVLDDVNDNAPVFQRQNYTAVISEATPIGTSFFQVTATDADDGVNARLLYTIQEEDDGSDKTFYVDASSGIIRVLKPLDRELLPEYQLTLVATDKGAPSLSGYCTVRVVLSDINDNAPRFEHDALHFYVPENSVPGTKVTRLRAVDPDLGPNAVVQYKIFGGPDMAAFDLSTGGDDADGQQGADLLTRTQLDYESKKNVYQLQLQASSGDLSTVVDVHVHVTDVNDNLPILNDFHLIFNNYQDQFDPAKPGRVPAYDPDVNDTLRYRLIDDHARLIAVDRLTGRISLSADLNTNRQIDSTLRICVSDGRNEVCAKCFLRVAYVDEAMLFNSATVRVADLEAHTFLSPVVYNRFVDALTTFLPSGRSDVFVFSVRNDGETLNVSFSVRKSDGEQLLSGGELQELVYINQEFLSKATHMNILPFEDNFCFREPCQMFERCQNVLRFGEAADFITTDTFLFRSIHPIHTFVCSCPEGFAGATAQHMCDAEVNLCHSSPCQNNGTCSPLEGGFFCQCLPDFTGTHCELPLLNKYCLPQICHGGSTCQSNNGRLLCENCPFPEEFRTKSCQLTTRSFSRDSYVVLPPLKARNRFEMKLSFATSTSDGLLFYNGRYHPRGDFMALYLKSDRLVFTFSLGNVSKSVETDQQTLSDGQWHTVIVKYFNRTVTIVIDECDETVALLPASDTTDARCAVKAVYDLEEKCSNPSVSCYRFFDLTGPMYVGGFPKDRHREFRIESASFDGCIGNLSIDRDAVDFSKVVAEFRTKIGCDRLRNVCQFKRPCQGGDASSCRNVWNGYVCRCDNKHAGQNCSDEVAMARRLKSDDSLIIYELPSNFPLPFAAGISFRSRQSPFVALAIEFTNSRKIIFQAINNESVIQYGDTAYSTAHKHSLLDGEWHTMAIVVSENHLNLTIDHLPHGAFLLETPFYGGIKNIYSGVLQQASRGCVKGVFISRSLQHPRYLKIVKERAVDVGCDSGNGCAVNPCPSNAVCAPEWDSYTCKCLPGYVGRNCIDVCSLKPCADNGLCRRNKLGYSCQCSSRHSGQHCEVLQPLPGEQCPKNWWGYPLCSPCKCNSGKGFDADCDKLTGQCKCKALHYQPVGSDRCFPCDCYFPIGAKNTSCDFRTGQCDCRGDVIGRRCDSCSLTTAEINRSTGTCQHVPDACPEVFQDGILWPKTRFGKAFYRPCPRGLSGSVYRQCNSDSLWDKADFFNCSSSRLSGLHQMLSQLDQGHPFTVQMSRRVAGELTNVSRVQDEHLYGRDLYVIYRLLMAIFRRELQHHNTGQSHIQDKYFVQNILEASSELLSVHYLDWWRSVIGNEISGQDSINLLLRNIEDYGAFLAGKRTNGLIRPFCIRTNNIFFAVDSINGNGQVLMPKYDNFAPQDNDAFDTRIIYDSSGDNYVFYSIFKNMTGFIRCYFEKTRKFGYVNAPLVAMAAFDAKAQPIKQLAKPISIVFRYLDPKQNTNAKCVWWKSENETVVWSETGCRRVASNRTHMTCSCNHLSIFAVVVDDWNAPWSDDDFRRTISTYIRYAISGASVLALLGFLIYHCNNCFRQSMQRTILKASVLCFCISVIAYCFVEWNQVSQASCRVIGAVLQFANLATLTWQLFYLIHLYRLVIETKDVDHGFGWVYCLFGWGFPSIVVCSTVVFAGDAYLSPNHCWFDMNDYRLWAMAAPIGLVILCSWYVFAICAAIGYSRKWDILSSKLNFRVQLTTAVLSQSLVLAHGLLALVAVNWQLVIVDYAYDAVTIMVVGVYLFMIRRPGPQVTSIRTEPRRFCIAKNIFCTSLKRRTSDDEDSSKFGVKFDDPSAIVSRPETPDGNLPSPNDMFGGRNLPKVTDTRTLTNGGEMCSPHLIESRRFAGSPIASSRPLLINQSSSAIGSLRLNTISAVGGTLSNNAGSSSDEASTASYRSNICGETFSLRRPIKPDLIPSWEAGGGYATIRRPLLTNGRHGQIGGGQAILSPVQKVLSDSESDDAVLKYCQKKKFETFSTSELTARRRPPGDYSFVSLSPCSKYSDDFPDAMNV